MLGKILISFLLSLSLLSSASASTENLKKSFDELNYTLTVLWDQKDESFYQSKMEEFNRQIITMLEAREITQKEISEFLISEIKSADLAEDLQKTLNLISYTSMSKTDAIELLKRYAPKTYTTGASWNGEILSKVAVGAVVVGALIFLVSKGFFDGGRSAVNNETPDEGGWECSKQNWVCEQKSYGEVCYYDCLDW